MTAQNRFLSLQIFILLISMIILLSVVPVGGSVDLYLIQPWVNASGIFPERDNWYLSTLNHRIVKDLVIAVYSLFFLLWCASFKIETFRAQRWQYGYMFWVSILGTCVVGLLKSQAAHACPWNMTHATATGFIWDFSATQGHCFPGGHASSGFALMTGYFVYRLQYPARARFYLIAGAVLGFAMGWAQMMRGAHFLSHNLWTLWVIWALNVTVYAFVRSYSNQKTIIQSAGFYPVFHRKHHQRQSSAVSKK
ncbi:phosphatase PAP2 family protein [Acinetobacter sp. WZC-1]|uniref:phosphatase PAP2 family protein n=1 Tax=Acinetobacter sp. WZC-1 TaxID=3459034 RepID=UPI00403D6FBC